MSRVRNLVDYQSQISDLDGDGTRNLTINGTITATAVDSPTVPKVDLSIAPEILEIQVAAPAAGQDVAWLWTWETSSLPYARRTITNSAELQVPLYKQGTYVVNNFAAYDLFGSMTQTHSLYLKWIDGAGTDNLVSWAVSAGPISDSHPDINSGNATDVQRITINVPATITLPTLTPPSVSYTVTNNGAGAYTFSGSAGGDNPNIGPFYRGGTYTFNVNASGHPFYLTTDNGTNFAAGTYFGEYTSGVTGSRSDNGSVTIVVPNDAPDTLYYQCGNHSAMRGAITVKDLAVETNINGNYIVYFQHTQEGHKTPVELRPIPSLVNQMCIVYDASVGKFVPQDLATYVENTPSFENKIREVAGTAELVVEDGSAVIAKVNVYDDSTYLPLTGNNPGDQAFATDTDILYIWDGTAWQQAGAANTDDLAEGTTNLFYTDARVGTYLSAQGYDTATNIIASITDSAPATLDTLNELAAALGDDPNFATTVTNSIATKANTADVYTQTQVNNALALKAPTNSPTFTGTLTVSGNIVVSGTVDGVDVAATNTKLTTTITGAGLNSNGTYSPPGGTTLTEEQGWVGTFYTNTPTSFYIDDTNNWNPFPGTQRFIEVYQWLPGQGSLVYSTNASFTDQGASIYVENADNPLYFGVNNNQTYLYKIYTTTTVSPNYIGSATSLNDADKILDDTLALKADINNLSISYAGAVGNASFKVYSARPTVVGDGTGTGTYAPWATMRGFVAAKSGTVRMRAGMYITSGPRYFSFRVVSENTGQVHFDAQNGGGFGAYEYPSGQAGNVHNYKYYEWTVPDLIAGHNYFIQMVPSSSNGGTVYAEAQNCWLGELEVYSQSPGETWGAPIYIHQDSSASAEDYNYDYISGGYGYYNNQEFRGTEETFLGWYTFRAYSRFLDVRTNINSDSYMFFMRATGYLYNDGLYNSAMRGGYTYTNNSVINQHNSTPSGSRGFYNFYRDGNGFLCAKLDKVNNGYTEGKIALFFGEFGPANNGVRITHYVQNDTTSNYY